MATKEDVLEQIVEDYLITKGYFVQHNVKFRPRRDHPDFESSQDSNYSDIDVLAINPTLAGPNAVFAVSCKSWQAGFDPRREIAAINEDKVLSGRERWRSFRELCKPKWSEAFMDRIQELTDRSEFTHVTAVSRIKGEASVWETHPPFHSALNGNPIKLLSFETIFREIAGITSTTLASTEIGRLIQMLRAAGLNLKAETNG